MPRDQGLDRRAILGIEIATGDEMLGQRPRPVARPGQEGGDELALVDQAVLQGDQAEQQVVVGGDHGRASWSSSRVDTFWVILLRWFSREQYPEW
jgi:hypothetical protein